MSNQMLVTELYPHTTENIVRINNVIQGPWRAVDGLIPPLQWNDTDSPSNPLYSDEPGLYKERETSPLKNKSDILSVMNYFLDRKKYRDYLLFTFGINTGYRVGDLCSLKFGDIFNPDFSYREDITITEQKTQNTRGTTKKMVDANAFQSACIGMTPEEMAQEFIRRCCTPAKPKARARKKPRHVTINPAMRESMDLYLQNRLSTPEMDEFIFRGVSNRNSGTSTPLTRSAVGKLFKKTFEDIGIPVKFGTHGLRKTFGYQHMANNGFSDRSLQVLQKMYGHSSTAVTLAYIGLTSDEMKAAYIALAMSQTSLSAGIEAEKLEVM